MSDNAAIIEKLKKMLALAERGGTEEEAANAANMAMALAMKHGIDLAALQTSGIETRAGFKYATIYEDNGGFEQWLINLLGGICAAHGGKVFYKGAPGMTLYCAIVREDMVPLLKMTMEYLVKTVLRLNTEAVRGRSLTQPERAQFRKAFRIGCSARIRQRLYDRLQAMMKEDEVAKAATGSTALVVVNHLESEIKEMQDWMQKQGFIFRQSKARGPRTLDSAGYQAGRAAGDRVGLDAQLGGKSGVDSSRRLR